MKKDSPQFIFCLCLALNLITPLFQSSSKCFAQYTKLYDFGVNTNVVSFPKGSLVSDGTFLYGMTHQGGTSNQGIIYKIKPDGTEYTKILDFLGATNGAYPLGSLIFDGTFLYGMTSTGGTNNQGTIFKIMPDGTGYSMLFDFATTNVGGPYGSLTSDGTYFYGMTRSVIFRIKSNGTEYSKLYDLTAAANGNPNWGWVTYQNDFLLVTMDLTLTNS